MGHFIFSSSVGTGAPVLELLRSLQGAVQPLVDVGYKPVGAVVFATDGDKMIATQGLFKEGPLLEGLEH